MTKNSIFTVLLAVIITFISCDDKIDVDVWKNKVAKLEADLKACEAKNALIPFNASEAKAIFGKKIRENDLTVIEGIGPKIEELFNKHGVKTWKELSEASLETCQRVLDNGGDRFKMHKPNTWPKQAKLAYEGKWQDLHKWQDELDGGK